MRLDARRDDGAGAIVVIAMSGIVVVAFVIALLVTDLLSARARAAAAADLGALAGAPAAASRADDEACATAAWVVHQNDATLRACTVIDLDISVTASARPKALWSRWLSALAAGSPEPQVTARAGLR
ncbi:unannotated protein [freshwater metagenome]|uniref:Unannotated protein n=1 Tax=freshwater metagenome TaxID=449393 RepID=A0A6J7S886_9ZZZZ|nr:pilus assembly protein TadE [Actinomycetota bacterium]MSW36649.1 pilus assembly protein TadE [Actinomycetota bacterium]MSX38479.1 pilus assembly protein TadE [Actinomycetota bacterium]